MKAIAKESGAEQQHLAKTQVEVKAIPKRAEEEDDDGRKESRRGSRPHPPGESSGIFDVPCFYRERTVRGADCEYADPLRALSESIALPGLWWLAQLSGLRALGGLPRLIRCAHR